MTYSYNGFDHVQLAAPKGCEDEARRFFGDLLGMPEIEKPEALRKNGGCWFACGPVQIHIGVEADFAPARKAHPAFLVQNVGALRDRVLAHGLTVLDDTQIKAVKRFFLADPWGNRLEFMEIIAPPEVFALSVGKSDTHLREGGREWRTAIYKQPQDGTLWLGRELLEGDQQEHLEFHGGPDRALCVYAYEHYAQWEEEFGIEMPLSAFGENLTARGLKEWDVCIGDIYRFGDALIQVAQPRIPCTQVDLRNNAPGLCQRMKDTGFTGYFFRVLEEGRIGKDLPFTLVERDPQRLSILEANEIWFHRKGGLEAAERLQAHPALADAWKQILASRIQELKKEKDA